MKETTLMPTAELRARLLAAGDAAKVCATLEEALKRAGDSANDVREYVRRMVASTTPWMDENLLHALVLETYDSDIEGQAVLLLANARITDEMWDTTLAGFQTIKDYCLGRMWRVLASALLSGGRLGPSSRTAAIVQDALSGQGDIVSVEEAAEIAASALLPMPLASALSNVECDVALALHPEATAEHMLALFENPFRNTEALLNVLLELDATFESPQLVRKLLDVAPAALDRLRVRDAIAMMEESPAKAAFWAAVMIEQAVTAGERTPPTFVRYCRQALTPEQLALVLESSKREVRVRGMELLGSPATARRSR